MQPRRTDVEDDVQTRADRDDVTLGWHRPAGPCGRIGPQSALGRRSIRRLCLGASADRETGWSEQ